MLQASVKKKVKEILIIWLLDWVFLCLSLKIMVRWVLLVGQAVAPPLACDAGGLFFLATWRFSRTSVPGR